MGAGHVRRDAEGLFVDRRSAVHRLPAAAKLAGLLAFVTLVAVTPRTAVAALAVDGAVVLAVVAVAGLALPTVAARLAAIAPFVAFALALPLLGTGDRVDVGAWSLSVDGLWAMWGIVAKAAIGAGAGIVVTATTRLPDLLAGLAVLRVPRPIVAILAVMLRYVDLLSDDLGRMRRAMVARGHDPRWLWQAKPIAGSVGTLFVRTYERGERVHLAMVARGFDGTVPAATRAWPPGTIPTSAWAALPAIVAAVGLGVASIAR